MGAALKGAGAEKREKRQMRVCTVVLPLGNCISACVLVLASSSVFRNSFV